jgi:hypothetical protein
MGGMRNSYKLLVTNPEGNRLQMIRCRCSNEHNDGRAWTGLIWLMTRTSGRFL